MRVQRGLSPILCALFLAGSAQISQASSHRESYTITKDPTRYHFYKEALLSTR